MLTAIIRLGFIRESTRKQNEVVRVHPQLLSRVLVKFRLQEPYLPQDISKKKGKVLGMLTLYVAVAESS